MATRPPIAHLIYEQRIRAGLSIRQAAARAGISEGSWRRTESNRKLTRTNETIARMASAVDLTGEQLARAGWPQAAEILATLSQPPAAAEPLADDDVRTKLIDLEAKLDELLRAVRREPNGDKEEHHEGNANRRAV